VKQRRILFFILLFVFLYAIPVAFAQEKALPDFAPVQKGDAIESPDWSQFQPQKEIQTETPDVFFKRCMSGGPTLPVKDQEALCACMAANVEASTSAKNPVQSWSGAVARKQETPYEYFLTDTYASCAWVEMGVRANDDCYRQTRFRVMFRTDQAFDRYCTCYGQESEAYIKKFAKPLFEAYLASPAAKKDKESKPPSRIIMDNTEYNIYMEKARDRCMRRFSGAI
jgi:hypothetical protein